MAHQSMPGILFFQPEIFDYLKNDSTMLVPDPLEKLLAVGKVPWKKWEG